MTYLITDQVGRKAVIRRPPLGELLPKAHDMNREWSLISSLAPTGFPVPEPIGFCTDLSVTGALFYVMGFSDGRPLYTSDDTEDWVPESHRLVLTHSFIDTLADLHSLDPDEIGLGSLAKKEDYIGRQVKAWYRSWQSSIEPAALDDKRAHTLREFFLDNKPLQQTASVVHGDYYFHNCLIGANSTVSAVLDWELSTLGDPLADLGYTLKGWPEDEKEARDEPSGPASLEGFPYREVLAKRYADRTGLSIDLLDYYIGFNHWKSAAILHGVYARYRAGQKSTEGIDVGAVKERILLSLDAAMHAVSRLN